MKFSEAIFPNKQIVFDAEIKAGENVLLYGDVTSKLIKETLKAIGKQGKLYVIGRNQGVLKFRQFTRPKYAERMMVNPFFEDIPENCLNLILIVNAIINIDIIPSLAIHAQKALKEGGRISIIDDQTPWDDLIKLGQKFNWLQLVEGKRILTFNKK